MSVTRNAWRIAVGFAMAVWSGILFAETRTWTDLKGATVEAEFVRLDGMTVHLKRADGTVFWAVLGMLSGADQEYVRSRTAAPAVLPAPTRAPTTVQIEGTFEWNGRRGETHELEATLKPEGANKWNAVWKFKWNNRPMTYEGTVTGDLQNGEISGTGIDTRARRTFTFEGTAKNGVWTFQHYETTRGSPQATGPGTARVKN